MASTNSQGQPDQSSPEQPLTWRVWLPRKRPLLSVVVTLVVVGLVVGVAYTYGGVFYPVLALLVLVAAISGHYMPSKFTLDAEGVTVASVWGRRTKPWENLKTYWPNGDHGVTVSPTVRPGPLTLARDIYLHYEDNREEVLRYLARHLSPGKTSPKQ